MDALFLLGFIFSIIYIIMDSYYKSELEEKIEELESLLKKEEGKVKVLREKLTKVSKDSFDIMEKIKNVPSN